jgi:hypothetical protein
MRQFLPVAVGKTTGPLALIDFWKVYYLNSMTLYEFSLLSERNQAREIWQGNYVMSREGEEGTVMLYKVHGFYVEVFYNREDSPPVKFNPFISATRLHLYYQICLN